jgi:hypothetical protein
MKYALLLCTAILASAETLHYSVNWPSGLSLGEVTLLSGPIMSGKGVVLGWAFELNLDAGVPGFAIRDQYNSTADADFCSQHLDKKTARGARIGEERVIFDRGKNTATRETIRGGQVAATSQVNIPTCARDALTLLQFVRKELAQGRLPSPQPAILGAAYQVRLDYLGMTSVALGNQQMDADRFRTSIKGPASDFTLEMFFRRDAARTPVMMKIPLPLATFTVELIP